MAKLRPLFLVLALSSFPSYAGAWCYGIGCQKTYTPPTFGQPSMGYISPTPGGNHLMHQAWEIQRSVMQMHQQQEMLRQLQEQNRVNAILQRQMMYDSRRNSACNTAMLLGWGPNAPATRAWCR